MILGSVKVDGQNIDLVQVERIPTQLVYQYRYIVQADVEGIEKKVEAKGEPKRARAKLWVLESGVKDDQVGGSI
jgi:hypothetical protein